MIPSDRLEFAFTTSADCSKIPRVPLADSTLGVHKVSQPQLLTHRIVVPPQPTDSSTGGSQKLPLAAWESLYPAGSISPSSPIKGGFGFYLSGPEAFKAASADAREVIMGYEVMFEESWEWVKGGKLPGIFGGIGNAAYGCSGGRKDERCKCFDLRLMWRANGLGELYAYLPLDPTNTARLLAVPPFSHQNPDYGFSVGRGAWRFTSGKWIKVATRIKMNDVGQENGEVEVYIDGESVIRIEGLVLRDDPASYVQGLHFQTFFGGHSADWASPKDQRAWFTSVSGAVIRDCGRTRDEL
ncbi:polysaccharide lyase family 14 protein [Artomyces pyxidatus]|uniref:Polysaccharide lyase family 14 protein n=1 Tax=Artomyces pyxidatus TaxID=48021 RepID=A0ACB8T167_9AGAM|nr:polysaccharide lyase family 14 protein [Artomyces pyxidatus]